jgi:hypothetical protein
MAHYDELTDLPNRALFYDRLKQSLAIAKRNKTNVFLLFLDLEATMTGRFVQRLPYIKLLTPILSNTSIHLTLLYLIQKVSS